MSAFELFTVTLTLCLRILCTGCVGSQPNIVIILADDMGWNDVGFHGSNQIPTPNIDALSYNGIILHRYYTQHICTPSRAALLTGNYPIRSGMQGTPMKAGENRFLPLDMPTLPQKLKELGYTTHLIGKWHLGAAKKSYTPVGRGYDSHFGYWNGYVGYLNYEITQNNMTGLDLHNDFDPVWSAQKEYATHLFTKEAIAKIESRNKDKPFFMVVSHLAGHAGKDGVELEVPSVEENSKKYSYIKEDQRRLYAEIINIMDKSVGDIVATLAKENILNNTVILFSSDNGAITVGQHQNSGSNWPLRGLKSTLLEGGVRNVGALYIPHIQNKGVIYDKLVHISDWFPTFYAAAGGNLDKLGNIDGVNQWPAFTSNYSVERSEILVNIDEQLNTSAIISDKGRHKLVNGSYSRGVYDSYFGNDGRGSENPPYNLEEILASDVNKAIQELRTGPPLTIGEILALRIKMDLSRCREENVTYDLVCGGLCLFDLYNDPCETENIASLFPQVVERLSKRLQEFWSDLVPQTNSDVDPRSDPKLFNNTWYTWLDTAQNVIV